MRTESSIGAIAVAAVLTLVSSGARAADDPKYPDMTGQWLRTGNPNWRPVAGPPPLTPEYQAMFDANQKDMANGGPGDVPSWYCLPQGMPMMMNMYDPMEVVITPKITYILDQPRQRLVSADLYRRPQLAGGRRLRAHLCRLFDRQMDR